MTETSPIRRRIQPAAATPTSSAANNDWAASGRSGFEKSRQIAAQRDKMMQFKIPRFGLWLGKNDPTPPNNEVQADLIVLDAKIDDIFFAWEHQIQLNGDWNNFEFCVKEHENCPLCAQSEGSGSTVSKPYYAMFLSVIDMRPAEWTDKDGVKHRREHQKKLLVVKQSQHSLYEQIFRQVNGNIRGLHLLMTRNLNDNKSAKSGVPSIADITRPHVSEEAILESFGHDPIMSKKDPAKVIKPKNDDCYPFAYGKIFKRPTAESLASTYGGRSSAGSRREAAQEFDAYEGGAAPASQAPANNPSAAVGVEDDEEIPF